MELDHRIGGHQNPTTGRSALRKYPESANPILPVSPGASGRGSRNVATAPSPAIKAQKIKTWPYLNTFKSTFHPISTHLGRLELWVVLFDFSSNSGAELKLLQAGNYAILVVTLWHHLLVNGDSRLGISA